MVESVTVMKSNQEKLNIHKLAYLNHVKTNTFTAEQQLEQIE